MNPTHPRISGFTLLEVVATVLIVGVLASIAYVGLGAVWARADLNTGTADLAMVAATQTRHATATGTYAADPALLTVPPELTLTTGPAVHAREVSLAVGDDGSYALATFIADQDVCLTLSSPPWGRPGDPTPGTLTGPTGASPQTVACDAQAALPTAAP